MRITIAQIGALLFSGSLIGFIIGYEARKRDDNS